MSDLIAACPTCGMVHEDLQHAESEVRKLRRQVTKLKGELEEQASRSPKAEKAQRLFDRWYAKLGKNANTVFDPKRKRMLVGMLELYEQQGVDGERLMARAIDGLARLPYVGPRGRQAEGTRQQRFDDLKYAVQDAGAVERFVGYMDALEEADRERRAGATQDLVTVLGPDHGEPSRPRWHSGGLEGLLAALEGAGSRVVDRGQGRFMAQCPAHEDRDPSLSIAEKDDGRVLIYCWAGCASLDVLHALGLEFADIGGACGLSLSAAQRTFGMAA